jgi:hypothetical protein
LVVAAEGGCDQVTVSLPQVHERLSAPLAGAAANSAQQENGMIEEIGAEAAAAAHDDEAVDGSGSPN